MKWGQSGELAFPKIENHCLYRMQAIKTRGLYTFYPIFDGQKRFFKELFRKILKHEKKHY